MNLEMFVTWMGAPSEAGKGAIAIAAFVGAVSIIVPPSARPGRRERSGTWAQRT